MGGSPSKKKETISADIIWADSDKNIKDSASLLLNLGCRIHFFNDTPSCIQFIEKNIDNLNIKCIITSLFGSERRRKLGHPNCFQMIDKIRQIWNKEYRPLLVMMTANANEQQCKDYGFDLIVYYDRTKMQKTVIEKLKKDTEVYYSTAWREPSLLPCLDLKSFATDCLKSLEINEDNRDIIIDRCFCKNCETTTISYRGDPKVIYELPIGWYRFGIKIREEYINNKIEMSNWHIGYHGTSKNVVKSIIEHRRIMFPGDTLNDGTKLEIKHGQCHTEGFKGPVIYVTPSINYAKLYAPCSDFNGRNVRFVFQCRIKPGTYKKRGKSYLTQTISENFSNLEIEWLTDDRKAVVPFGLLIGVF